MKEVSSKHHGGILTLQAVHAAAVGALNQVSHEEILLIRPKAWLLMRVMPAPYCLCKKEVACDDRAAWQAAAMHMKHDPGGDHAVTLPGHGRHLSQRVWLTMCLLQLMRQHRLAVVTTCHSVLKAQSDDRAGAPQNAESDPHSDFWAKREFLPRIWLVSSLPLHGVLLAELKNAGVC